MAFWKLPRFSLPKLMNVVELSYRYCTGSMLALRLVLPPMRTVEVISEPEFKAERRDQSWDPTPPISYRRCCHEANETA